MQLESQTSLAESLAMSLEYWRKNCETISRQIVVDDVLQNYLLLSSINANANVDFDQNKLLSIVTNIAQDNPRFENVYIVSKDFDIVGTGESKEIKPYIIDRISTAERNAGGAVWDTGYDTKSMMLFRSINNYRYNPKESLGYLFLQINNSEVLQQFDQYRIHTNQRFSLKGNNNGFEVTERGFFYSYYDDYQDLLHSEISFLDWTLKTWSDKTDSMTSITLLINQLIRQSGIVFLISLVLCLFIANQITKPIKNMSETLSFFGAGDFSARVKVTGHDELSSLCIVINKMADQISHLFEQVKNESNQRKKLELQTLIYQINPHFLYNTLDSVNVLARINGDHEVAEIVTDLSRLFRLGLNHGKDFTSVRNEVMHVTYYLKIQNMRFENQISVNIDIDPDIMEIEIIPFILQPLVENAIIHGILPASRKGIIEITGRRVDNDVVFVVCDNGVGMTSSALERLRKRVSQNTIQEMSEDGFGLWNVQQRIRLSYGDNYGIIITSIPDVGTKVKVNLSIFKRRFD